MSWQSERPARWATRLLASFLLVASVDTFSPALVAAEIDAAAEPRSPAQWYGAGVRPTEALDPDAQRQGFHLSAGYEIRLFASEPEIAKPMNLAFDARGRLWVTDSFEYPYPAPPDKPGRDCVRILEDTDGDGRADRVTVFADGLNIPIGVLPYGDGCLCFSIPNIYHLRDTDGDGRCDRRDVVLGPFDTSRDTHGMVNSLRIGSDGWVYANHGFNNQSTVVGTDGHTVAMQSGNTFRFRPDGSRVEQVTWGQVNPFGRTVDDWGYDYTADCHSKPISQLISGGFYPSFGRPHDGLGFVPSMMEHLHGSTAIAGVIHVNQGLELPGLEGQMLSGNVMTSRLNRNRVRYVGATAIAEELGDFLTSDDPWFRPVDLTVGPDGMIYVADFYNKIIGHYEVPLEHPERDWFRGRIWQIRPPHLRDKAVRFEGITAENVAEQLIDPSPHVRGLALQEALLHPSPALATQMRQWLGGEGVSSEVPSDVPSGRIAALWYLARHEPAAIDPQAIFTAETSPRVRLELLKVVGELAGGTAAGARFARPTVQRLAIEGLEDDNPHVVRQAAELLGRVGDGDAVGPLLERLSGVETGDAVLRQTIRIALRNLFRSGDPEVARWLAGDPVAMVASAPQRLEVADVLMAVPTAGAAQWLLASLRQNPDLPPQRIEGMLDHCTSCYRGDSRGLSEVIAVARGIEGPSTARSWGMLNRIAAALPADSDALAAIGQWGSELVERDLRELSQSLERGQPLALQWRDEQGNAWPSQVRKNGSGQEMVVTSSFPLGEQFVGRLESDPFVAPAEIQFWIAGHNGYPDQPDGRLNRIELIDAGTGTILQTAYPPRNDALVAIRWDCGQYADRSLRIAVVDGDRQGAYAWLAVGGFEPAWLEPSGEDSRLTQVLQAIDRLRLQQFRLELGSLLAQPALKMHERAAIGETLAKLNGDQVTALLFSAARDWSGGETLPETWIAAVRGGPKISEAEELVLLAKRLGSEKQRKLAERLAANRSTAGLLLELVDRGAIGADVLVDKEVAGALAVSMTDEQREEYGRLAAEVKEVDRHVEEKMSVVAQLIRDGVGEEHAGRALFEKQCAICHQIAGAGQLVGPQLDGVGGRGSARLLEDILMPDRNVDRAFRAVTVLTVDGQVKIGLPRAEKEGRIEMVGNDGKVFQIEKESIESMRTGNHSLMPGNFHETLTAEQLASLVRYLALAAASGK